jgi:hypothetical protein
MEHTKPTRSRKPRVESIVFDLAVNGRSYAVSATPFDTPAGKTMFRVSYNNGPVHVFSWDDGLDRYAEIDKQADFIPPVIEMAIADELQQKAVQLQKAA